MEKCNICQTLLLLLKISQKIRQTLRIQPGTCYSFDTAEPLNGRRSSKARALDIIVMTRVSYGRRYRAADGRRLVAVFKSVM